MMSARNDTARRGARERQQAQRAKDAHWISSEQALKIDGTDDPTRLRMEIKLGLPCRFRHRGRWWQWKPVEEVAPLLAGRSPLDLQDDRWELVVHEKYWRERVGKPAEMPPIVADTTSDPIEPSPPSVRLRNAPEAEIRNAVMAEYHEAEKAGRKPPNTNELQPLVQERLKTKGYRTSGRKIAKIGSEEEFDNYRLPPGQTWKTKKVTE